MKFVLLVEGKTERQSAGEFLKRIAAQKCPRLTELLEEMLRLARDAGL